jgi:hypothetical protein
VGRIKNEIDLMRPFTPLPVEPPAVEADVVAQTEDELQPLSDRDRDLFLNLLDNPPEPNDAFLKAAAAYRKRHG